MPACSLEQQAAHIVNRDHVGLGHEQRHAVERDVVQVGGEAAQEEREGDVARLARSSRRVVGGDLEIAAAGRRAARASRGRSHQHVLVVLVDCCQRLDQVADVGADAEIADAADVDDDLEHTRRRPRGLPYRWSLFQLPAVEREIDRSASGRCGARRRWFLPTAMLPSTSAISAAVSRISGSRKPRVVTAGTAEAHAARD